MPRAIAFVVPVLALAAGATAMDAKAATVFSNSFESPVVVGNGNSGNGYDNYGTGSMIGPWTVVGPPGAGDAVSVVKGTFSQTIGSTTFTFPAQSGNQWADLAGQDANSPAGVSVTVSGLLNQKYTVSFWIGNLVNPGGPFGVSSTVNLLIDGVPAFVAVNTQGTGQSSLAWQEFVYESPLASLTDAVTFTFLSGDPPSDFNNAFDNVVISTLDASEVPLPAALPMFASGLGALGLFGWQRKRKKNKGVAA